MTNASKMMGIRERENTTAMLRYPFEGQRHGLHANDLPIASSTVQTEHHPMVFLDQHGGVRLQIPLQDSVHVAWRHAYTVRIVPAQVSHYQIGGNLIGFLGGAAALLKRAATRVVSASLEIR